MNPQQYPQQPNPQQSNYPPQYPNAQQQGSQTNTMAIFSLVFAIFFAPAGLVLAIISLGQIKRSGESGRGLAIAGLIISLIQLVLFVVGIIALFLLTFLAAPSLQTNAFDTTRKNGINNLQAALTQYASENNGFYPTAEQFKGQTWGQNLAPEDFTDPETGKPYSYDVSQATCGEAGCDNYVLSVKLAKADEKGNTIYSLKAGE